MIESQGQLKVKVKAVVQYQGQLSKINFWCYIVNVFVKGIFVYSLFSGFLPVSSPLAVLNEKLY